MSQNKNRPLDSLIVKQTVTYVIVLVLTVCAFYAFFIFNRNRATERNRQRLEDSTVQLAERIDHTMSDGLTNVQSLARLASAQLTSAEADADEIRALVGETSFDFIECADKNGLNHTVTGETTDARDRKYFKEGMAGHSGSELIFNSRATHETMVVYYAPVTFEDEPVAVLLGIFRATSRLSDFLDVDYFGYKAELYLCSENGRVVAADHPIDETSSLNAISLAGSEKAQQKITEALRTGETCRFTDADTAVGGCLVRLPENGWYLVQIFPEEANAFVLKDADELTLTLEVFLLAVLLSGLIALTVFFRRTQKTVGDELFQAERYKKAVLSSSMIIYEANLTKNHIETGYWESVNGEKVNLTETMGIAPPCPYDEYITAWNEHYIDEGSRRKFGEKTSRENLLKAFEEGQTEVTFEYHVRTDDGIAFYARRHIFLTRDERTGDVIAYCNVKDITEQKNQERMLQNYEQILLTTASGLYRGVRQVNLNTYQSAYVSFENGRVTTIDMGDWDTWVENRRHVIHPDDFARVAEMMDIDHLLQMKLGESCRCDYRNANADEAGAFRALTTTITRTVIDDQPYAILLTMDNTAAVKREMEQSQLIKSALLRAENANKAKTSFLSNMSHDIRTPMNAILGFTDLARRHADDRAAVADYLGKIASSGDQLLSLINNVLDMSRIESGRVHLEEGEYSLFDEIDAVCALMSPAAEAKGVSLTFTAEALRTRKMIFDRLRLVQILQNLIGNAVKFTNAGGSVMVTAEDVSVKDNAEGTYEVRVRDTGIGMSEEFQKRIFEPFEREENETVVRTQGTGLGMSITKNLVELMGGTIRVISTQGTGTEFVLDLPMGFATGKAEKTEEKTSAPISFDGERVLLVDDNELNREIACELLTEAGLYVEEAENGKEALEKLTGRGPGYFIAVLMDVQMPVMDGYEATAKIRGMEEKRLAEIPIIAMTANAFEEDRRAALAAGMDAHLAKPINVTLVLETLAELRKKEQEEK